MEPHFEYGPMVFGLVTHFAVAIFWGVLFALVTRDFGKTSTVALGVPWGIAVWVAMFHVLLPLLGMVEVAQHVPVGLALFEHILYGVTTAGALVLVRERMGEHYLPQAPVMP
jgi:uncharacterized membrane protein YagU involved in acid resistance